MQLESYQPIARGMPAAASSASGSAGHGQERCACYAEHNLMILDQLRPREFKGGYATTYGGCLTAPIGVLCLVVYRVDLLRRSVCSASVAGAVECWFGSRFDEARIG